MKKKSWIKFSIIFCGLFFVGLLAHAKSSQKNSSLSQSLPQDDMADPFGDGDFNMDGPPPGGEGPPQLPGEDDMEPPRKGEKGPPPGKPPQEGNFLDEFGPLPPDSGIPGDFPPLPNEEALKGELPVPAKEEPPVPPKEEAPAPFAWSSIDLHNLATRAGARVDISGRKVNEYKA